MTVDKYVYFDYMATTPVDPIVVEKMCEYLGPSSHYGNPASTHYFGQVAKSAVEKAREQVANAINATVDEIVWPQSLE